MKEHGILMSQAMIQAYIAGRKTMTRRTSPRWEKAQEGDGLWFRETWQWFGSGSYDDIMANTNDFWYRASCDENADAVKWRPSIFMPRRAARFTPPILEIRKERLQDITTRDCMREGWNPSTMEEIFDVQDLEKVKSIFHPTARKMALRSLIPKQEIQSPKEWFIQLWNLINGDKPGKSWDDNPEVYVISFPRHVK